MRVTCSGVGSAEKKDMFDWGKLDETSKNREGK